MISNTKFSIEQYQTFTGWGNYEDDETSNLVIGTTPTKFTVNSLGAATYNGELPIDSDGVPLWDSSINKIIPIHLNDAYEIRILFEVTAKTSSPLLLNIVLDIGATGSITVPVYNTTVELSKTVPFSKGYSLLAFARDTFLANNGQIFLSTDAGAITIVSRAIFIKRDHRGRNGI